MFGIFKKIADMTEEFIDDPVGTAVDVVAAPVRDASDIVDGLTEGELRLKAAARLGVDVACGMALSESISWYADPLD